MKFNLYYIQETLAHILSQLGHFYIPSSANKKRVKDFFMSFPFFFFDIRFQSELYDIIQEYPITSYYDHQEDMKDYCFYIYFKFSENHGLASKSKQAFYDDMTKQLHHGTEQWKQWKQHNIQDYLFGIVLVLICVAYYFFEKTQ